MNCNETQILHKHHIVPKHAGGSDEIENIVYLSVSDHAEAHRKLFEQYGRWQDEVAWKGLSGIIGHEEAVKLSVGHMRGKKHRPETIAKMKRPKSKIHAMKAGLAKKGCRHSKISCDKISKTRLMRIHTYTPLSDHNRKKLSERSSLPKSDETKKKMSIARSLFWERKRKLDQGTK